MALLAFKGVKLKAKDVRVMSDLHQEQIMIENWNLDHGSYPNALSDIPDITLLSEDIKKNNNGIGINYWLINPNYWLITIPIPSDNAKYFKVDNRNIEKVTFSPERIKCNIASSTYTIRKGESVELSWTIINGPADYAAINDQQIDVEAGKMTVYPSVTPKTVYSMRVFKYSSTNGYGCGTSVTVNP